MAGRIFGRGASGAGESPFHRASNRADAGPSNATADVDRNGTSADRDGTGDARRGHLPSGAHAGRKAKPQRDLAGDE